MSDQRLNITRLAKIAFQEGRDAFLASSPYPVLVPRAVQRGSLVDALEADSTLYHLPTVKDDISMYEAPRVLIVRRRSDLGKGQVIHLGRTTETDLSLTDHSVSKLHAAFHRVAGAHWKIEDLGSKNGTWIEDMRLIPGVPVEVESKQELRFGRVHLRFLAPEDLYTMLMEASGASS